MWHGRGRRRRGTGGRASRGSAGTGTGMTEPGKRSVISTGTLWIVQMAMRRRHRWGCTKRMRLVCTMCQATCGSGRRTAGTRAIRALRPTGAGGGRGTVPDVCCAAAPGSLRTGHPPLGEPQHGLQPGTGSSAHRVPSGPDDKLSHTSLPLYLLHGGPGGSAPWSRYTRPSRRCMDGISP